MPRGGNNRIPPSQHLARGTYRKDRHSELPTDPITPPPLAPDPPTALTDRGRVVWDRLYPLVTSQGIVTELDRYIFAAYCQFEAFYTEAAEHVRDEGCFKKPKRGESAEGVQHSKWYRLMRDSLAQVKSLAAMLGLTPVDRHRVTKAKIEGQTEDVTNKKPVSDLDRIADVRLLR
ncbi:phage terminase small subunit P27 family [Gemmata sp. G18]|uniref:Phage terminase small subunit P27 family n=1 Tax=Gemmata palustris TaxID=2822762 RepID=A0ABS5BY89_9BACT|nr:phage terminase small subunit P27 family [Gemmata palustris]MBP3958705.1 phage terminase small subunit P27 family [Gemmata palustris]